MTKNICLIVAGAALAWSGACDMQGQERGYDSCVVTRRECHVAYSAYSGYQRYCSTVEGACADEQQTTSANRSSSTSTTRADAGAAAASSSGKSPAQKHTGSSGAAPLPDEQRYSAFDEACTRDSQCGPGKCSGGECFYGCQSDAQCGSGDRCAVETGTRICEPDPNPPVQCTRTAQCKTGFECLNGSCRQTCSATEQCTNLLDRCASGVCQPDRRPLGECVLDQECSPGFVCLDGACVQACSADADAGVCLSASTPPPVKQPAPAQSGPGAVTASGSPDAGVASTPTAPASESVPLAEPAPVSATATAESAPSESGEGEATPSSGVSEENADAGVPPLPVIR